jgi:hypothetical protein
MRRIGPLLTCLQGQLTVNVEEDAYKVNEDDVLAFAGELNRFNFSGGLFNESLA